jgi:general stress protein 26
MRRGFLSDPDSGTTPQPRQEDTMADQLDQKQAEDRLWKEIDSHRQGMLGVVGGTPHHFQPMTQFAERETGTLWFFTRTDTDLVHQIDEGKAMFVLQNDRFQACIGGRLSQSRDRERIDKFWGPVVAAWYPEGKDDPNLVLLRFDLEDAELWLTDAGPIRFAFEVARANTTGREPDLGDRAHLDLR